MTVTGGIDLLNFDSHNGLTSWHHHRPILHQHLRSGDLSDLVPRCSSDNRGRSISFQSGIVSGGIISAENPEPST